LNRDLGNQKGEKEKRTPPPILVNLNEWSFIGEKSSNGATRCFYVS
jgi:hypothetical protein